MFQPKIDSYLELNTKHSNIMILHKEFKILKTDM